MFRILAITATLLGVASAAQADVYRWTDAKGTVQYSDKWVPGSTLVKGDKSHVPQQSADAASEPGESSESSEPPADPVEAQREKREMQQDVAKVRAEQCKQATEQYNKAIASRRIYKQGEKGERSFISDAEADAYRLQLLNARKQACGS
jgi:hypothetical protein